MAIGTSKVGALGGLVPGGSVTFNASGTFCVPPGVKKVSIEGVGGAGNPGNPGNAGNPGNPGSGGGGGGGGGGIAPCVPVGPTCFPNNPGEIGGYAVRPAAVNITTQQLTCGQPLPTNPGVYIAKGGGGAFNQQPSPSGTGGSGQAGSSGSGGSAGNVGSAGNPGQTSSGLGNTFPGGAGGAAGNAGNAGNGGSGGTGGNGGGPSANTPAVFGPPASPLVNVFGAAPFCQITPYANTTYPLPGGSGGSGGNGGGSGAPGLSNKWNNPANPSQFRAAGSGGGGAGVNGSGQPGFRASNPNPNPAGNPPAQKFTYGGGASGGAGCFPWSSSVMPFNVNVQPTVNGAWGWGGNAPAAGGVSTNPPSEANAGPTCGQPIGGTSLYMQKFILYGLGCKARNPSFNRVVQIGPQLGNNIPGPAIFRAGGGGGVGGPSRAGGWPLNYLPPAYPGCVKPQGRLYTGGGGGGGGGGRGNAGNAGGTGGAGGCGQVGTPTTFNCVSVTPGCSYPITVACGGSVTISWNPQ